MSALLLYKYAGLEQKMTVGVGSIVKFGAASWEVVEVEASISNKRGAVGFRARR